MAHERLNIHVETYNPVDDEITASRDINYNDPLHRQWFTKHMYWALMNGMGIEVSPVVERPADV